MRRRKGRKRLRRINFEIPLCTEKSFSFLDSVSHQGFVTLTLLGRLSFFWIARLMFNSLCSSWCWGVIYLAPLLRQYFLYLYTCAKL